MAQTRRYWDGGRWTDHIAPMDSPATPAPQYVVPSQGQQSGSDSGLIAAGFIFAILMPIIGFIIGIVLLARRQTGPGIGSMILSLVAFFVWADVLTPEPTLYDNYDY